MVSHGNVEQYSKVLVARYLRENGFQESLEAFSKECSLSFQDTAYVKEAGVESLEAIVAERIAYTDKDLEGRLEKLAVEDRCGIEPGLVEVRDATFKPVDSVARKGALAIGTSFYGDGESLVSYADRVVDRYNTSWTLRDRLDVSEQKFGAVKLCGTILDSGIFYLCGLDGSFVAYQDSSCSGPKLQVKLHQRMITHVQFFKLETENSWLVVSCGLDNFLRLHKLDKTAEGLQVGSRACEKLISACTSLLVTSCDKKAQVFVTRTEFTHVLCYEVDFDDYRLVLSYKIALSNAEFSTFSFNVRDMVFVGKVDDSGKPIVVKGSALLVATSHTPYMRLIEVEIPLSVQEPGTTLYNQIVRNVPTEVDQDSYSEPVLKLIPRSKEVLVGDSYGVYAVDILTGRSWLLDLPTVLKGSRVKCMDINRDGTKLIVALSDKTVAAFDIII